MDTLYPEEGGSTVSETLLSCHITTWCHNPEDHNLNEYRSFVLF